MLIVAIAWMFVVVLLVAAEAMAPQGTLLGAFFTLLGWGVLPLAVVLYVMGGPARRRARLAAAAAEAAASAQQGDAGGHPAGGPVPPVPAVREEP